MQAQVGSCGYKFATWGLCKRKKHTMT